MKLDSALEQLLIPYSHRLQIRPGNGLTRSMNASLRSYNEIPLIIRRSVECLATVEYLFGLAGHTSIHYIAFYKILIHSFDDWYLEVPTISPGGTLHFIRKPRVPIHRFLAAWTIARRLNLLTGRGEIRLHMDLLQELRRLVPAPQKGGDPQHG